MLKEEIIRKYIQKGHNSNPHQKSYIRPDSN